LCVCVCVSFHGSLFQVEVEIGELVIANCVTYAFDKSGRCDKCAPGFDLQAAGTLCNVTPPPGTCQDWATQYAIIPGNTWGTAPDNVRTFWVAQGCNAIPAKYNLSCQEMADRYNINPVATPMAWGSAAGAGDLQAVWGFKGCAARSCQSLADEFNVIPGHSWGTMPVAQQAVWISAACNTFPASLSLTCQQFADKYQIVNGVSPSGTAPASVKLVYGIKGCASTIVPNCTGYTWVGTSTVARCSKCADDCTLSAAATCIALPTPLKVSCQNLADQHGIISNLSFGSASVEVQQEWKARGCSATAAKLDCQVMADTYSIAGPGNWGMAPADIIAVYKLRSCNSKFTPPPAPAPQTPPSTVRFCIYCFIDSFVFLCRSFYLFV
jgi:hypothetical protein